ncbi:MAG: hydrolase [Pseudomonadales bacterium]|nr:hydrolase [Pseudomonadales bacterium]
MLTTENSLLVIIDVQGKLATLMHDKEAYLANLKTMIKASQAMGIPILWAEQIPEKLGSTLPEISELLTDLRPIAKTSFSCFGNDKLLQAMVASGRNQMLVTGIETHVCVYQSALDLMRLQKEVHVVCDAVSSRSPENKQLGLEKMKTAGAHLTSTETCLFELMKTADHPVFKEIVTLFK